MRTELKNAYFKTKADQLSFASEQRDTEQEFRLMKQHTSMQVPVKWLTASITCLYNKGRKSLAKNYRGLSIIATVSKVVSVVIMERISEVYEHILMPSQFGFRANRSTIDAIYVLGQLFENAKRSKKPLLIAFVDLKAAYDWIPRDALFKCLEIRLKSLVWCLYYVHSIPARRLT